MYAWCRLFAIDRVMVLPLMCNWQAAWCRRGTVSIGCVKVELWAFASVSAIGLSRYGRGRDCSGRLSY